MAQRAAARGGPSTLMIARIVVTVAGVALLLYAVYLVRSLILLVIVAAFLAIGLDPAVRRLETWGIRRGFAVAMIFTVTVLFLIAFIATVIPPLISQIAKFATNLPHYVQDLAAKNPRIQDFVEKNDIAAKLQEATKSAPTIIGSSFSKILGAAGSVLSALFRVLTVLVLTIYFSMSLGHIRSGTLKLVPKSRRARVSELLDPILEKIGGYIAGNIAISIIAGAAAFVFMAIAGVPFPVALALWVAIADLIPLVGATLGAVPAVIVAFFASVPLGIATLVYFVVYQQVENYVIAPRVMTKAVDISPAAVLVAALVGGNLLGFVGALMAIPAAAAIKLIAQEVILPRTESA
jgi:predicted PurR-regulated permease PerM